MDNPAPHEKATIAELVGFIWPHDSDSDLIPWWPPDVYAVAATILRRTGGYVRVLELPRDDKEPLFDKEWPVFAREIANEWRDSINQFLETNREPPNDVYSNFRKANLMPGARTVAPGKVNEYWNSVLRRKDLAISDLELKAPEVSEVLIRLCCVADDASSGIGIRDKGEDEFLEFSMWVLGLQDRRSVCSSIPYDRIGVLPKQHTPQRGLTLRSLSHNLSLHPATEVTPRWRRPLAGEQLEIINLLLLPWPVDTEPSDFRSLEAKDRIPWLPPTAKFFAYEPQNPVTGFDFKQHLERAFKSAGTHAARIHGIVFPELALSVDEFEEAERFAFKKRALLMAGVRVQDAQFGCKRSQNVWAFQTAGLLGAADEISDTDLPSYLVRQGKHHRWCLDRDQILQYGLGGRLPASKDCWELTDIAARCVEFFTIDSWLTWAVLICEDLARQDPVADVIRAVGPNMVVALLMDGPQLKERWPSRYASVLAEDPGCSVLTLTSLGMSRLTKASHPDNARSNVIALWRDAVYGVREIELENGDDACVLSLVCKSKAEYTADGRSDEGVAHFPVYAGLYSFKVPVPEKG